MFRALFILLLAFLSCSLDPVVIDPESMGDYYVDCLLSPTFEYQEVLVGKSIPESKPVDIKDAQVSITDLTENVVVTFTHIKNGIYRDIEKRLNVVYGHSYHLEVTLENGQRITGEKTLPDDFEIRAPAFGDTLGYFLEYKLDTLQMPHVGWTASENASFYSAHLLIETDNVRGGSVFTYRNHILIPEIIPKFSWADTLTDSSLVQASLVVFAYDSSQMFIPTTRLFLDNFVDYTREEWQKAINSYSTDVKQNSNVQGGIGRFDGLIMAKTDFYVQVYTYWHTLRPGV